VLADTPPVAVLKGGEVVAGALVSDDRRQP
jgi:hypothetical protein